MIKGKRFSSVRIAGLLVIMMKAGMANRTRTDALKNVRIIMEIGNPDMSAMHTEIIMRKCSLMHPGRECNDCGLTPAISPAGKITDFKLKKGDL
jgi:hypothetical protein